MTDKILLFALDRGFVIVGRASIDPDLAFHWKLSPGRTIRRWGTKQGLAELRNGPLENTVLDPPATRHIPFRAVLDIIEVEETVWTNHLPGE